MKHSVKLNDGHILEALDRIHVAIGYLENSLLEHSLLNSVPDFQIKVSESIKILADLYQEIGQVDSINDLSKNKIL